jgi:hypothetical protein
MYAQDTRAQRLGSWWNDWGDLWGDITDFAGGGGGPGTGMTPPPGYGGGNPYFPYSTSPAATGNVVYDDLSTIQQWKDAVIAEHGYPTRIPQSMQYAGELADRSTGPNTDYPNAPWPWTYNLAPANVIAADHRLHASAPDSVAAIIPDHSDMPPPGTPGAHWWDVIDWKKYLLWGAIGVGAIIVVPAVLPALIPKPSFRRNPPRRRRRRR